MSLGVLVALDEFLIQHCGSFTIDCASTVAVVVPSPAIATFGPKRHPDTRGELTLTPLRKHSRLESL
jgi:hypothetical protein